MFCIAFLTHKFFLNHKIFSQFFISRFHLRNLFPNHRIFYLNFTMHSNCRNISKIFRVKLEFWKNFGNETLEISRNEEDNK